MAQYVGHLWRKIWSTSLAIVWGWIFIVWVTKSFKGKWYIKIRKLNIAYTVSVYLHKCIITIFPPKQGNNLHSTGPCVTIMSFTIFFLLLRSSSQIYQQTSLQNLQVGLWDGRHISMINTLQIRPMSLSVTVCFWETRPCHHSL